MALGSAKTLTEIITSSILGDKDDRCVGLTTLQTACADCLEILRTSAS